MSGPKISPSSTVFTYGYFTVARSAGICAARTLRLLDGPTREVRIERGLVLTLNEYRQEATFMVN